MYPDITTVDPTLEPKLFGREGFRAYRIGLAGPGHASPVVAQVVLQGAVSASPDYSPPTTSDRLKPICTLPDGWRPKEERWFTCQVCSYMRYHDGTPTLAVVRPSGVVAVALPNGRIPYDGAVFFDGVSFLVVR